MFTRVLIVSFILFFIELYAFQALRTISKNNWTLIIYLAISVLCLGYILFSILNFDRKVGQTPQSLFAIALLLLVYVPKIILALVMLSEDLFRMTFALINFLGTGHKNEMFLPQRRDFISKMAWGLATIPFISILYGITKGKYNFKVFKEVLYFPDLPDAFDGFTLTHISDIHSGSFDHAEKIEYAIDLINKQESDLLLFTGDIVNAKAEEMHPWMDHFNKLKQPKFGKYSILGNHDYGTYLEWESKEKKAKNFEDIKEIHQKLNFKLLLNEHIKLKKDDQEIALIGVENWGKHFGTLGDIDKASENLTPIDFKILMSHDPSHWEEIIKHHNKHFQLTLSGHTHGMQFGIEIPGFFKWSIAQYIYKQWAGCYNHLGRYIYVNRGFGFHAYPGRVGIMPEITVIELKKTK